MAEKAKWILEVDTKKGTANLKKFGSSQDQVTKRMKQQGAQAKRLKSSMGSLQGMILKIAGGVGLALLSKQFLKAANTAEQYRIRLGVLLRSTKEGSRMFKEMGDYAGKVPFQYESVMAAATTLSGVMKGGVDEVKKWIPLIGDLAAAYGLGFEETAVQIQKMYSAGAGAADRFRESGILAMMGFKQKTAYSIEETQKIIFDSWNKIDSQYKGATKKLATTWKGTTSMMADNWFKFRVAVMDAGPFRALKLMIGNLNKEFDKLVESGQMEKIAESIGGTVMAIFKTVAIGTAGLIDNIAIPIGALIGGAIKGFNELPVLLREIGIVGALMFGWKGKATLLAVTFAMSKLEELTKSEEYMAKELTGLQETLDRYNESLKRVGEGHETVAEKMNTKLSGRTTLERYKELADNALKDLEIYQAKVAKEFPDTIGAPYINTLKKIGEETKTVQDKIEGFSLLKAFAGIQGGKSPMMSFTNKLIKQMKKALKMVTSKDYSVQLDLSGLKDSFINQAKAIAGDAEAIRREAIKKEVSDTLEKFKQLEKVALEAGIGVMLFTEQKELALAEIKKKYANKEKVEREKEVQEKLSIDQRYEEAIVLSKGQAGEIRKVARENELEMVKFHYSEMTNAMLEHGYTELEITKFIEAQKSILRDKHRKEDLQRDQEVTQTRLGLMQSALGQFTGLYRDMAAAGLVNSKKTFGVYQALAMAEAGVSTASAVMKALNESALPFPLNAIWAGTVGAIGAAQMAMIMTEKPPSYGYGGISSRPEMALVGERGPEAHIPLRGGSVPVTFGSGRGGSGAGGTTIQLNNPVFQDVETMQMYMQEVAKLAVEFGASGAVIADYQNNGMIRDLIRGGY